MKDPPSLREVKLLANLFVVSNELGKLVTSQPSYEVSADLNVCFSLLLICCDITKYTLYRPTL
jgi:predicted metal-binding transcription factor (methanogenesis marker protein 9)